MLNYLVCASASERVVPNKRVMSPNCKRRSGGWLWFGESADEACKWFRATLHRHHAEWANFAYLGGSVTPTWDVHGCWEWI